MKYDFITVLDREGKDALAADIIPIPNVTVKEGYTKIPMWIADMNFETAPSIQEAIRERLNHGAFGYFEPSEEYYNAIMDWQKKRNGVEGLLAEHIGYENGVLGCVSSALRSFTKTGDPIMVHRPCYVGFQHVLEDLGYNVIYSDLVKDENDVWRMDYEDMDRKIKENNVKVCIFCTPHNPTGRVWEREEVLGAMEVYAKNDCIVISDEIWSDLILPGQKHIPTQSVSEDAKNRTVGIYAPSKTFNLAGLIGSYHIIYNEELRKQVDRTSNNTYYNHMNVLSMHALIGAYRGGEEWLDELREVLQGNVDYACDFIWNHFEGVKVSKPQGTYMLYLDCGEWCDLNNTSIQDLLVKGAEVGVIWQDGTAFGHPNTIRMNLASPKSQIVEAFDRLKKFVF